MQKICTCNALFCSFFFLEINGNWNWQVSNRCIFMANRYTGIFIVITGVAFQFFFLYFFHVFPSFFHFFLLFFLVFYWTHKTVKKRTHRYRSAVTFLFFFLADSLAIIYWWVLLIRAETASARRRNRGSIRNTDSFPSKFPWVLDPVDARQQFRSTTITDGLFI